MTAKPVVFLSYRREETRGEAGRVADRLGEANVFMDVDTIEPGADFVEVITRAIDSMPVTLG